MDNRGPFLFSELFVYLSFIIFGLITPCHATEGDRLWLDDGQPVVTATDEQTHARMASDGSGGAIIVWVDNRNQDSGDNRDIYAQRLDYSGSPMWGTDGIAIASGNDDQTAPAIVGDGHGGAIITWLSRDPSSVTDWYVYAQRINGNGEIQWQAGGVMVSNSLQTSGPNDPAIATDGNGGAFIAFDTATGVRCVRIFNNGNLYFPGINGIVLGAGTIAGGGPAITSDGSGGAIVAMADGKCMRAQKVTSALGLPWGTTPVNISCDPRREARPAIAPDDSGGAFVAWVRQRHPVGDPPGSQVMAQHVDSAGSSLWTPGGITLVDSSEVGGSDYAWRTYEVIPSVTADGTGGAVVAWNDWRNEPGTGGNDDIFAQRIDASGHAVWIAGGMSVWFYTGGSQRRPMITATGMGGSLVVFQDKGMGSWDIIAVKLDPDGHRWSSSQSYVYYDNPSVTDQTNPRVVFDSSGPMPEGAIIVWTDKRVARSDIYAQKIELQVFKPDLVIDSITLNPLNPAPMEAFDVLIRVKNQGNAETSRNFSVQLSGLQSTLFPDTCIVTSLAAGATGGCTISYPGKAAGSYPVTASADHNPLLSWNNVIDELDETNNSMDDTVVIAVPDNTPPEPNPMTWQVHPHGISTTAIAMEATEAVDASTPVEYLFACITVGCNSSDWQTSRSFTDTGLKANTWYGWRVMARDSRHNMTDWSLAAYDYTDIETPEGVAFDLDDVGTSYIKAKVSNTLSNLDLGHSGLIIYNVTAGTDSGWKQDNEWWNSNGLAPSSAYEFHARARNGNQKETPTTHDFIMFTAAAQPGPAPLSDITLDSITANWTANGNPEDHNTEYLCENTVTGSNSGWIIDTHWTDTGLECGSTYGYRVKARNAMGRQTPWTSLGSAKTRSCCSADMGVGDGDVDGLDLQILIDEYQQPDCSQYPGCRSDLNGDGRVDGEDLEIFASQFGRDDCDHQ